jgi:hypothetical protein
MLGILDLKTNRLEDLMRDLSEQVDDKSECIKEAVRPILFTDFVEGQGI